VSSLPVPAAPLGVVVVDDSAVQRRFLRALIDASGDLTVVGEARNGREAVALVERLRPGAVVMDLDLPVMNGIEAIERIMASRPTPIVVYSSYVEGPDNENAGAALAAGAVDVLAKPGPDDRVRLDAYGDELRQRLRVASRIKVITHPRGRLAAGGSAGVGRLVPAAGRKPIAPPARPASSTINQVRLLAIGASTGGPQALATVLSRLPASVDVPVVVVQHMADGFIEGLAGWLAGLTGMPVVVGRHGRPLIPGTVTVAPSGLNLIVHNHLRVTTEVPPTEQYHVPGIDVTFRSIARHYGSDAIGVLLTGMGRDGAQGLKELHDHGALTFAQDEASSAVYGMPGAAVGLGAVDRVLGLEEIGPALAEALSTSQEAQS
jgi:two-component system chemotaxis response regulator CheB